MTDLPMKSFGPNDADKALHADITALIKRHLTPDTQHRVLAIAAQVVGQVLALQDQRIPTDVHFQVILRNIEEGNQRVIDELANKTEGSA